MDPLSQTGSPGWSHRPTVSPNYGLLTDELTIVGAKNLKILIL